MLALVRLRGDDKKNLHLSGHDSSAFIRSRLICFTN
jgi:hypothetical protein